LFSAGNFDNATVFGGYSSEQVCGHVYCLNGTRITVSNNIIKNSGGQGIIFGYSYNYLAPKIKRSELIF